MAASVITEPLSLEELDTPYWRSVYYGGPGTGKTVFASRSQRFKTFVFDVDDGMNSARAFMTKNGLSTKGVKFWPVRSFADFCRAFDWIDAKQRDWDHCVVDTATELQRILLREVMQQTGHTTADQRDWGNILRMMEDLTVRFRHMELHVTFLAHQMSKADSQDEAEKIRPSFEGAFKEAYAKHFSIIGRMVMVPQKDKATQEVKAVHAVNFGPTTNSHFKDRSCSLNLWEEPDIDAIFEKILSSTVSPVSQITTEAG